MGPDQDNGQGSQEVMEMIGIYRIYCALLWGSRKKIHLEMCPSFLSVLVAAVQISDLSSPMEMSSLGPERMNHAKESECFY